MNQSKNTQRNQQFSAKDMRRNLEKKLRHTVSDSIRGLFDRELQQHDPKTGRRWVWKQATRLHGISGVAIVDAYHQFDCKFTQLREEEILDAISGGRALFVTTDPLHDDEFCPEFVTHHVTEFLTLDRLRFQIAEMFDLTVFISWNDEDIRANILPCCQVDEYRKEAVGLGHGYLYYRIGTEKDMRRILRSGLKMDHRSTRTSHRLSESEKDNCAAHAMKTIGIFVESIFDSELQWGVASPERKEEMREAVNESPTLLSFEDGETNVSENAEMVAEETETLSEDETMSETETATEIMEEMAVMA